MAELGVPLPLGDALAASESAAPGDSEADGDVAAVTGELAVPLSQGTKPAEKKPPPAAFPRPPKLADCVELKQRLSVGVGETGCSPVPEKVTVPPPLPPAETLTIRYVMNLRANGALKRYIHALHPSELQEAHICWTFPSVSWTVVLSKAQEVDMQFWKLCIIAGKVQIHSYCPEML